MGVFWEGEEEEEEEKEDRSFELRLTMRGGKIVSSLWKIISIDKVPHNYKITHSTGFIIFAPGHKVSYYLCTVKQSLIIFAQTETVNY